MAELIYNAEPTWLDIEITKGDTINMSFSVAINGVAYDMSGMQLDILIKDRIGATTKTLSSAGVGPAITISTSSYNITTTAMPAIGIYKYDVQLTDGTDITTIQKGNILVTEERT